MTEMTEIASAGAGAPLVLTIDVGTSSVRAMLFDAAGNPVPEMEAQRQHQMHSTADGGVETDAKELFDRVAGCLDDLLHQVGDQTESIVAVAPTTFWHSLIGVSARGEPVTPVFTWADMRAATAADALRGEVDAGAVHARTGCVIHPTYWPAKLRWLRHDREFRRASARVRRWLSVAEFLTLRIFGTPRCGISMASATGLLNQHTCTWDDELLHAIPLERRTLSPLDDRPCQHMRPEFARRWPALQHVPWYPGWGDGATSNVGCGCVTKQDIALMIGTSGAMRAVWRPRGLVIPPELWCYRVDRTRVVMGGALSNGGNFIDWLRATLRLPDDPAALEAAMAELQPDQSGITVLPFLAGERSPGWHSEARATFSGLSLHTNPMDIFRAGHETIAYRFGLLHAILRQELGGKQRVIASGGALLHSPTWMQILADVLDTPVTASAVPEASSRGAALLALEALGLLADLAEMEAPIGTTYRPNAAQARLYGRARQRQQALYASLIGDPEGPHTHGLPTRPSVRLMPATRG